MKISISLVYAVIVLSGIVLIPNAFAENVPDWVKNTAGWWAEDVISETEFVNAIAYLVKENIIQVNVSQTSETSQSVPDWVKNTAGWWAEGQIDDNTFILGIQYLIKVGIINIENDTASCIYVKHTLFESFPNDVKASLCSPMTHNLIFTHEHWWDTLGWASTQKIDEERQILYYNNEGFRNKDFEVNKPDNVYRIFAVGGSTTFGNGVHDSESWPAYLQKIINNLKLEFTIEVINAGIPGSNSNHETKMVKERLIKFEPDMILVFDGVNDWINTQPESWVKNWDGICQMGEDIGFETVIVVQPMLSTGERELSKQDKMMMKKHVLEETMYTYTFHEHLDDLSEHCSATADFRGIFDNVPMPVYFDGVHTHPVGNKIIADNFFSLISPFIKFEHQNETKLISDNFVLYPQTKSEFFRTAEYSNIESQSISLKGINLHGKKMANFDFQNQDLEYASFYNSFFVNSNLENANIANTDFRYSLIHDSNFQNADATRSKFFNTEVKNGNFSSASLKMSDWSMSRTAESVFSNASFYDSDLSYAKFLKSVFEGTNFSNSAMIMTGIYDSKLNNSNFENTNLTKAEILDSSLQSANFKNSRLIWADLSNNYLQNSIFINAELRNVNFTNTDLTNANLSNAILTGADFTNAVLTGANLNCIGHPICEND